MNTSLSAQIERCWKLFDVYEKTLQDRDYIAYLDAREIAAISLEGVSESMKQSYPKLP